MRIRTSFLLSTLLAGCCLLPACDLINPEEPIPAYLYVAPFTMNTVASIEGSSSAKITEGWVFVNGEFLGAYSLPALVPVIAQGQADIRIEAGIKENGLSSVPEINPFFEPYRLQRPLAPNEVDTIRPVTSYIPETKIAFIEDFEDNRPRIFTDQLVGSAELERTAMEVFEGAYSGVLTLDPDNALVEIASGTAYTDLLTGGVYVYLEVNYKSEAPVAWGIAANVDPAIGFESFVDPGFFPSEEWNKIYFSLSPIIYGANLTGEPHKVTLQAFLGEGSPDTARVYLDNIKLLHF